MHTPVKTRVWAMIETPLAIFNILSIAGAARDSETRLSGFVMGTNDLAKDTRARLVPGRAPMLPWLSACIAAARINGIDVLDGVYNDLGNADGFLAECIQGVEFGFDGKTLIHPNQIALCHAAFAPSAEELARAERLLAAATGGAERFEGAMIETMHVDAAKRLLVRSRN
jgi:citrate lyase subunit beta/citryl-CoA lyase